MEDKLIEFVRQHRFLYDKSHKNYKRVYLREEKFSELSRTLNIPANKLKARWRTLRDKFYRDNKKTPSGSGVDSPHKTWKWFHSLLFLKDVESDNLNTEGNYEDIEFLDDSFVSQDIVEKVFTPPATQLQPLQTPKPSVRKRKIEELTESANNDFKKVAAFAENVLVNGVPKFGIRLFFEGLAVQAESADLTGLELSALQLQMAKSFHEFMQNRNK